MVDRAIRPVVWVLLILVSANVSGCSRQYHPVSIAAEPEEGLSPAEQIGEVGSEAVKYAEHLQVGQQARITTYHGNRVEGLVASVGDTIVVDVRADGSLSSIPVPASEIQFAEVAGEDMKLGEKASAGVLVPLAIVVVALLAVVAVNGTQGIGN